MEKRRGKSSFAKCEASTFVGACARFHGGEVAELNIRKEEKRDGEEKKGGAIKRKIEE